MAIEILCVNPACGAAIDGSGRCSHCGWTYPTPGDGVSDGDGDGDGDDGWPSPGEMPSAGASGPRVAMGPGTVFDGRYRIEGPLGEGGMGVVYLAFDLKLRRRVAVKIPNPHRDDHPDLIKRFEREARIAAAFDHPNLCQVYDFGEAGGVRYLTMPFIEGEPLSSLLASGPLRPSRAAGIVHELALALAEAHRLGVIHRDLKPSNVMIGRKGKLIVMDFGVARLADSLDSLRTSHGVLLGTPAYMSPEQVEGDVDAMGPWTDIYCLGVIFYQLLTGQPPFVGSANWVCVQVIHDEPKPPSALRPALDPALEAVCLKAMAKKPGDRYASMEAMAAALEPLPRELDLAPGPPPAASPPPVSTTLMPDDPPFALRAHGESRPVVPPPRPRPRPGRGAARRLVPIAVATALVAIVASHRDPRRPVAGPVAIAPRAVPADGRPSTAPTPVPAPGPPPRPLGEETAVALASRQATSPPEATSQSPPSSRAEPSAGVDDVVDPEAGARVAEVPARDDPAPAPAPGPAPSEVVAREDTAAELAEGQAELLDAYRAGDRTGRDDDILKAWGKVQALQSRLDGPGVTVIIKVKKGKSSTPLTVTYGGRGEAPRRLRLGPGSVEMLSADGPLALAYPLLAPSPSTTGGPAHTGGGNPPYLGASLSPSSAVGFDRLGGGPPPPPPPPPHGGGPPPHHGGGPPPFEAVRPPTGPATVGPTPPAGGRPTPAVTARPVTARRLELKDRAVIVEFSLVGGRWKLRLSSPPAPPTNGLAARAG